MRVIRNGTEQMIESRELVPGDLLALAAGDGVGADAFLIESFSIEAGEAALTGESLSELVTTLLARLRGHDDIGLGTLLGSNLFNGLAIVGTAASIHPIHAPVGTVSVALLFGLLTVLLVFPRQGLLSRGRGIMLLLGYAVYVFFTLRL